MVQENYGAEVSRFSVGGVINASIGIVIRNVWRLLAICFLMSIPAIAATMLFFATRSFSIGALQTDAGAAEMGIGAKVLLALVFILIFLTYFATQAAVNYAAFQNLRGERVRIGACIARGVSVLPRLALACVVLGVFMLAIGLAVSFLFMIAAAGLGVAVGAGATGGIGIGAIGGVGFIAIFLFAIVIWWVFVPAIVAENAGPVACFGRSRRLTKGHRWGILGILLLVFLANIVAGIVVQLLAKIGAPAAASFVNVLVSLFFAALSSVLAAVGYYALRAEKEGFGIGDLAQVFD
jgi:hypothetical protein